MSATRLLTGSSEVKGKASLTSPWAGSVHKPHEEHNSEEIVYGSVWGPGTFVLKQF